MKRGQRGSGEWNGEEKREKREEKTRKGREKEKPKEIERIEQLYCNAMQQSNTLLSLSLSLFLSASLHLYTLDVNEMKLHRV